MTLRSWHRFTAHDADLLSRALLASNFVFAIAIGALFAGSALAQTMPPAAAPAAAPTPPPPANTVTANVGLFSEYIFRGIAQTAGKPAVQGGFDWSHVSGFYAGTWASNISWLEDFGAYNRSSLEWDVYGGYKQNFPGSEDWSYDLGVYGYVYPGRKNPGVFDVDTWELYGALGWKWVSLKLSYALTDYFGARPDGQKTDGTWRLRKENVLAISSATTTRTVASSISWQAWTSCWASTLPRERKRSKRLRCGWPLRTA